MFIDKSSAVVQMGDRGHNGHGRKVGGLLCFCRGELGTRLLQSGLGPRSTSVPSAVLINPAIWPQ